MRRYLAAAVIAFLSIGAMDRLYAQENRTSLFLYAGKGVSGGEWGLRDVFTCGVEFPTDRGFSVPISVNFLEYPHYTYGGLDRVISHGTKSEISIAPHVKFTASWFISPYIACGIGFAYVKEGEVVRRSLSGTTRVIQPQSGLAIFASVKPGFEILIVRHLAIGVSLGIAVGTDRYSDNFSGQAGIRLWL